jgi:hypothetical protein
MDNLSDSAEEWATTAIAPIAPGMRVSRAAPIVAILVQRHIADGTERTVFGYADQRGRVWPTGTGEFVEMDDVWLAPSHSEPQT